MQTSSGSQELDHTADWALHVWAPDLAGLIKEAITGMYRLMGIETGQPEENTRLITSNGVDRETLFVNTLAEFLLVNEAEGLLLEPVDIQIDSLVFSANCIARPAINQEKEIKAVTFHDLAIREKGAGLEVVVVFDV